MAKIDRVQEVSTELIRPYSKNAKIHTDEQVEKIAKSIQEFGFLNPCLIDRDFNLIAGHGRVLAAKKLGMETVPCIYIEGLTEAQKRAYILADNRLAELAEWDHEIISDELERLKDEGFDIDITGFEIDDIDFEDVEDIEPFAEPEAIASNEPRIKRGQIWQLGNHRLMCGDSTDPEDVGRLIGSELIDLCITDPPYNVDVHGKAGTIENDNLEDSQFIEFLTAAFKNLYYALKPGASFYIWFASTQIKAFTEAADRAGLDIRQHLIWVKNTFTLGRQDYQWRHETCLYGWRDGDSHYFIDMRSLSTVQEYDLESKTKEELVNELRHLLEEIGTVIHEQKPVRSELHPTMKPVSLIKKQIRNSSVEGQSVLDLFGGSGTTLIACEEMNRRCFMMEYDPHYAEAIISRWEEMTGKGAVLL